MLVVLMFCSSVSFQMFSNIMLDALHVRIYQLENTVSTADPGREDDDDDDYEDDDVEEDLESSRK